jgi:hypothetical protein
MVARGLPYIRDVAGFSTFTTLVCGLLVGAASCSQGTEAAIGQAATSATTSQKKAPTHLLGSRMIRADAEGHESNSDKLDGLVRDVRARLARKLHLAHPQSLKVGRVLKGNRNVVVHLGVMHRGIPVLGPSVVAHARLDHPERMKPYITLLPLPRKVPFPDTAPLISAERAKAVVAAAEPKAPRAPRVEQLALVARTKRTNSRGHYRPAPRIVGYQLVYLVSGWKNHYRVDARTGKIIERNSVLVR